MDPMSSSSLFDVPVEASEPFIRNEEFNGPKLESLHEDSNPEKTTTFREEAIDAAAWGAFGALCGGAWGLAFGIVAGTPLLLTIGLFAADTAVTRATKAIVESLGDEYELKHSTICYIKAAVVAVISTAFIVTAISLGIFGSIAIGFFAASALASVLLHLAWSTVDDESMAEVNDFVKEMKATFKKLVLSLADLPTEFQKKSKEAQVEEPQVVDVTDTFPTLEGSRGKLQTWS